MYDFFAVPYREWWDYRSPIYGDKPIGASCFSQDAINLGVCDTPPTGPSGETASTYPYINWWPWTGDRRNSIIYAPYRLRIAGVEQPGSTLSTPVILPVLNPLELEGGPMRVHWSLNYVTTARINELNAFCASVYQDGYLAESRITITMDLQQSKRIFGVVAGSAAEAQAWWNSNVNPDCAVKGPVELKWESFMGTQGGANFVMGAYDIYNAFEWYYQSFMSDFVASVDPLTGITTVTIDHVAWGTEVLLSHWFYWGSKLYLDAGPDGKTGTADDIVNAETYPHDTAGWWQWELAWFEDLEFDTTVGIASQSFTLSSAMQYQFQAYANPGDDGVYNTGTVVSTDDLAEWTWQPYLDDYNYGGTVSVKHTTSELDPYAGMTYYHGNPGTAIYGTNFAYDYVPGEWDLGPSDTVVFRMPTTMVRFVDPYSPLSGDPSTLVIFESFMNFSRSTPALPPGSSAVDTNLDSLIDTVTLVGPIDWGAPTAPGALLLLGLPYLEFMPGQQIRIISNADLIQRSAWPDRHHFDMSRHGTELTFHARVTNLGNVDVTAGVLFTIKDSNNVVVAVVPSNTPTIPVGGTAVVDGTWTVQGGKFSVSVVAYYDGVAPLDGVPDTFGIREKSFSFTVVP